MAIRSLCEPFQRVFAPSSVPFRADARIVTNEGMTGQLGRDLKYQFGKNITLLNGSFSVDPKDLYATFTFTPEEFSLISRIIEMVLRKIFFFLPPAQLNPLPAELPMSLFEGAKENDTVSFNYQGRPIELTLKQLDHPLAPDYFEDFLNHLKIYYELSQERHWTSPYLFYEDMPEDSWLLFYHWIDKTSAVFFNGNECHEDKLAIINALSQEAFEFFKKYDNADPSFMLNNVMLKDAQQEQIGVGIELNVVYMKPKDVKILIDYDYICVIGERTDPEYLEDREKAKSLSYTPQPRKLVFRHSFNAPFNPNNVKFEFDSTGRGLLTLSLQKEARRSEG